MSVSRNNFYIQCENCLANETIRDGLQRDSEINFRITGESVIEVVCKSCNNTISVLTDNPV
ncbi:hypothetical protein ABIA69_003387 [Lysinibacillus parviboronicapiens]|uniref:Uncharacterized protein n=1 Tax=Lysinibacillus parviboronicapiens TaxID=436516 RepID=A0ABV2PMM8_9BACI